GTARHRPAVPTGRAGAGIRMRRARFRRLGASTSALGVLALLAALFPSPAAAAPTTYALDTFNRSVSGGWGTADTGGAWTIVDSAAHWSVAPGAGSIQVSANGQERAELAALSVQDVEVLQKVTLPMSSQPN